MTAGSLREEQRARGREGLRVRKGKANSKEKNQKGGAQLGEIGERKPETGSKQRFKRRFRSFLSVAGLCLKLFIAQEVISTFSSIIQVRPFGQIFSFLLLAFHVFSAFVFFSVLVLLCY